jgi:hypothetical protein
MLEIILELKLTLVFELAWETMELWSNLWSSWAFFAGSEWVCRSLARID